LTPRFLFLSYFPFGNMDSYSYSYSEVSLSISPSKGRAAGAGHRPRRSARLLAQTKPLGVGRVTQDGLVCSENPTWSYMLLQLAIKEERLPNGLLTNKKYQPTHPAQLVCSFGPIGHWKHKKMWGRPLFWAFFLWDLILW